MFTYWLCALAAPLFEFNQPIFIEPSPSPIAMIELIGPSPIPLLGEMIERTGGESKGGKMYESFLISKYLICKFQFWYDVLKQIISSVHPVTVNIETSVSVNNTESLLRTNIGPIFDYSIECAEFIRSPGNLLTECTLIALSDYNTEYICSQLKSTLDVETLTDLYDATVNSVHVQCSPPQWQK